VVAPSLVAYRRRVTARARPSRAPAHGRDLVRRATAFEPLALLWFGVPLVAVLVVLATVDAGGQGALWEHAHWTVAGLLGTLVAGLSVRGATGIERRVRVLIAAGAGAWLIGQLTWDVQTALGLYSRPAPSDIGFLGISLPAMLALIVLFRGRLPLGEEIAIRLDATSTGLAITAAILAAHGDPLSGEGLLSGLVTVAYPIVHLATAGAGFVVLLALGVRVRPIGGYLVFLGFAILGVAWVAWLQFAAVVPPAAGNPLNALFSVGIVVVGAGCASWCVDEAPAARALSISGVALGILPLPAVLISAALIATHAPTTPVRALVDIAAFGAFLVAGLRQTILVLERGRLLLGTERVSADLAIALAQRAEADTRYRTLVERVPAAVYIDIEDTTVSDGGRLDYMSPQIEAILGYPPSAFVDDPELWPSLIHPEDRATSIEAYYVHWRTGEPLRVEYRMFARDGSTLWLRDEAFAMAQGPTDSRRRSQGLLVDITERKRLEAQLLHDAVHDPLTGLANRVLFREHLDRALRRRLRRRSGVAVLFLDLDDFKVVNDSLGHRAGDRLLIEVACRLTGAIRAGDVVARQGGDEFTVLLDSVRGIEDAVESAERIAAELHRPIDLDGHLLILGVSIGIALSSGRDDGADDLLAHADAAMYAAKEDGKARHAVFDPTMRARARSRLETEAELRRALDEGAFMLEYQPIVELASGRLAGFEALVRWCHPDRGLIQPLDFIPLAEATGLIVPLGRFVTETACRQLREWRDAYPALTDLTMSVNVSPRETIESGFAAQTRAILAATDLDPSLLVMEITESIMVRESVDTDGSLRQLVDLGVGLAVDDFGTGFSALEYFKRFAISSLKLDRSFIVGLGISQEDLAIVTATLAFAAALDLSVTAEGVETAAHVDRLRALGCRRGQGFHFARPMPADEAAAYLARMAAAGGGTDATRAA
jgi:diguanylate cyclase (GGDEF)-like protein/PAS domain S-box-containing protein